MKIADSSKCRCKSENRFGECCKKRIALYGKPILFTNFHFWSMRYMKRRYLEYVSQEELVERENDIVTNLTYLKDDLSRGVHFNWIELWAHVQIELAIRENRPPKPLAYRVKDEQLPRINLPGLPEAIQTFKDMRLNEGTYWVKFGKYKFLKDALERGQIRISPATSYNESHLNSAQKDDELKLPITFLPSEKLIQPINNITGEIEGSFRAIGNLQYTLASQGNYYAYCLALTFDPRLFSDFPSDCVLIIKNRTEFIKRIMRATKEKLAGYKRFAGPITYSDPFHSQPSHFPVCFSKHFRYTYQKEYRIVWIQPGPIEPLNYVDVDMGSLEDICEIIRLPFEA